MALVRPSVAGRMRVGRWETGIVFLAVARRADRSARRAEHRLARLLDPVIAVALHARGVEDLCVHAGLEFFVQQDVACGANRRAGWLAPVTTRRIVGGGPG